MLHGFPASMNVIGTTSCGAPAEGAKFAADPTWQLIRSIRLKGPFAPSTGEKLQAGARLTGGRGQAVALISVGVPARATRISRAFKVALRRWALRFDSRSGTTPSLR